MVNFVLCFLCHADVQSVSKLTGCGPSKLLLENAMIRYSALKYKGLPIKFLHDLLLRSDRHVCVFNDHKNGDLLFSINSFTRSFLGSRFNKIRKSHNEILTFPAARERFCDLHHWNSVLFGNSAVNNVIFSTTTATINIFCCQWIKKSTVRGSPVWAYFLNQLHSSNLGLPSHVPPIASRPPSASDQLEMTEKASRQIV
jgi:hypothetical protein